MSKKLKDAKVQSDISEKGNWEQLDKMATLGQLTAGVAHEVNNPMSFILSNLETLQEYVAELVEGFQSGSKEKVFSEKFMIIMEDMEALVGETQEGALRVKEIVLGLRDFSRPDAGMQLTDLNACLTETIKILANELKYKADVVTEFGDVPAFTCYANELKQVFTNLIINASQAIESFGQIKIKTFAEHQDIVIVISDTGKGIAPEHVKHLFDPFFTTKPVGQGTGLGLSIVKGIIEKHRGQIDVETQLGAGTTFSIRLSMDRA